MAGEIVAALEALGALSSAGSPQALTANLEQQHLGKQPNSQQPGYRVGTEPQVDTVMPSSMSSKRSAKVTLEGVEGAIHPVVRLGWKTLCHVHCNGLTGMFLGGHDRELYIRCTSGEYASAPLIDIAQGGCIMTCSQFEKAAGRELSKKWKESIHVVGEGEGSKATLIAWLKRKAEANFGERVVNSHVWICFCSDGQYRGATISGYSKQSGKHMVVYEDGSRDDLHLPVELLSFDQEQPVVVPCDGLIDVEMAAPPDRVMEAHPPRPLGRSISLPGAVASRKFTSTLSTLPSKDAGLHHQGSGVSVSSTYDDEDGGGNHHKGGRKHERSFRGRVRHESHTRPTIDAIPEDTTPLLRTTSCTAARHPTPPLSLRTPAATRRRPSRAPLGDEDLLPPVSPDRRLDSDTPSPPPKRTRTVVPPPTARAILQHSVSLPATLATGGGGAASAGRQASGRAAAPLGGAAKPPRSPTDEPIGLWAPGVLGVIPPPPRSGLEETNMRCISVWMNGVALALDQPLMQALEMSPITSTWCPYEKTLSPSARFQLLLVHARRSSSSGVHAMYEAMLSRVEMFASQGPRTLQAKMVDFILAALHEDSVQTTREMLLLAKQRTPPTTIEVEEQFGQHAGQHAGGMGATAAPPVSPEQGSVGHA